MKTHSILLAFTIALISLWSCKPKSSPYIIDVEPVPKVSSTVYTPEELEALCSILNRHDLLSLYNGDTMNPYQTVAQSLLLRLDSNLNHLQIQNLASSELGSLSGTEVPKEHLGEFAEDVSSWLKTGNYINEKGQVHIRSFYIDQDEVSSNEYREFIPDSNSRID